MTFKGTAKKVWHFLWEEESLASWIACFVLAFLIIRFVFFPLLGLVFASPLPLVIVESKSMEHQGSFEQWWTKFSEWYEANDINKKVFGEWSFPNGLNKGDIIAVQGSKNYKQGDIIIFKVPIQKTPIIHRIVVTSPLATKGDNNNYQLPVEKSISQEQILGKAVARIPKLGWTKLVFVELFRALS